jgi:anti-sigma factor RsiW
MPRPSDERLIAYLDGELDEAERAKIAHWLERDAELQERATRLSDGAALLRSAFDEVLHEPLPERLIRAARGDGRDAIDLASARKLRRRRLTGDRRWWIGAAVAVSLAAFALGFGVGGGDVALSGADLTARDAHGPLLVSDTFSDNLAGYYRRYVTMGSSNATSFDKLPPNFHVPNLKPWGLQFQGGRFLMAEGQPAMALLYTTDNKALGPVLVVVANSTKGDETADFAHSGNINVLRWRHHGHVYAIAGTASINYLWNIHNDLVYQFDTI